MKVDNVSCMSWEQQQAHDLKRMIYFYTTLVEKKNWDYTTAQSPEVEFLPRYINVFEWINRTLHFQQSKSMLLEFLFDSTWFIHVVVIYHSLLLKH